MLSGVDVSRYQGTIRWSAVASDGIGFVFAKATEGGSYMDPWFTTHRRAVRAAGLRFGAYHFMNPLTEAEPQAETFLWALGTPSLEDLPPALDVESTPGWATLPVGVRQKRIAHFLTIVRDRLAVQPLLYVSPSFWIDTLGAPSIVDGWNFAEAPLWIAHYTHAAEPTVPSPWNKWTIWQHSDQGSVSGISGPVDLDWMKP